MGLGSTYDQTKPITTTIKMMESLLAENNVDLKKLRKETNVFTKKDVVTDLVAAAKASYKQGQAKTFQTKWKDTLVDVPMMAKLILKCENPESLAIRKSDNKFCVS